MSLVESEGSGSPRLAYLFLEPQAHAVTHDLAPKEFPSIGDAGGMVELPRGSRLAPWHLGRNRLGGQRA